MFRKVAHLRIECIEKVHRYLDELRRLARRFERKNQMDAIIVSGALRTVRAITSEVIYGVLVDAGQLPRRTCDYELKFIVDGSAVALGSIQIISEQVGYREIADGELRFNSQVANKNGQMRTS